MSKKLRKSDGKFTARKPLWVIITTWIASFSSLALLYVAGRVVVSDFASLRPCSTNSSGLYVSSCGKQSLNMTDLLMIGVFALCAVFVVTLFTAAVRMIRGQAG